MKRVELKKKARELIKGNLWYLWKPLVMVVLGIMIFSMIFAIVLPNIDENIGSIIAGILDICLSFIEAAFMIGYAKFVIEFVRGNKLNWRETIDFAQKHFWLCVVVTILVGLLTFIAMIPLLVPALIVSIGLTFYQEVCADEPELGDCEIIKKAWRITKGYRLDIFVLGLSFIGWNILAWLTFGILYIWLMPYMIVTYTLAYEFLRKQYKK